VAIPNRGESVMPGIIESVEALAAYTWPGVILMVLLLFRPQLQKLLARLTRIKVGRVHVEFKEER
jgi:hypothetical protein